MTLIDPSARVAHGAAIGKDVTIGPYCVIDANVSIGEGCRVLSHVHITGHTTIGPRTMIYPFASLGTPPQSVKYRGGPTKLVIGADCEIRESVTMNTGTEDAGGVDRASATNACSWWASHVGHDCIARQQRDDGQQRGSGRPLPGRRLCRFSAAIPPCTNSCASGRGP